MRSRRRLRWAAIPLAVVSALALAGCTQEQLRGYLPGDPGLTNHTERVTSLWVNAWVVLLIVGAITWGLIIWCAVVYRRRRGQTGLPVQLRYNLPIEVFYTVVPIILILGFFAFTARDQAAIEEPHLDDPDVVIDVYGKRWSWDFNYVNENVHFSGTQARQGDDGQIDPASIPTLYLPVGQKVQIDLNSRDVQHSFWIVDYLYKKDLYPGLTNRMYFVPLETGTFAGKCAELCGEYHSLMLFNVKVVEPAEYDAYIQDLRDRGFDGLRGEEYNTIQSPATESSARAVTED